MNSLALRPYPFPTFKRLSLEKKRYEKTKIPPVPHPKNVYYTKQQKDGIYFIFVASKSVLNVAASIVILNFFKVNIKCNFEFLNFKSL